MPKTQNIWRILIPVALGTTLSLLGDATLYTVLPTHSAEAGISLAAVGVMLSANRFIRLFSNGPVGWLADRYSLRPIFTVAMFVGALSTLIYAFTTGYWPLFFARLLWGCAWSGIWIAGNALVLGGTNATNRGRIVGIFNLAYFSGSAAGAMLGGWLTDLVGYHSALTIEGLLTLAGAVIVWVTLPASIADSAEKANPDAAEKNESAAAHPTNKTNKTDVAAASALLAVNRFVNAGLVSPTLALFVLKVFGEEVEIFGRILGSSTLTGIAVAVSTIMGLIAVFSSGMISDWVRSRWLVVILSLLLGVGGLVLMAQGRPLTLLGGLCLAALARGSNQGLTTTLIGDASHSTTRGRTLSILFTIGDLASALGPLLAFRIIGSVTINSIYLLAAIIYLVMLTIAALMFRREKRVAAFFIE